ncbi:Ribosome-associated protein, partial [Dysosmobacter welbionis]
AGPFMRRSGDGVAAPDQQLGGAGRGADAPALNGHHVQVVLDQRTAVVQRCGCGLVNETGAGGRNAHSRSHSQH